MNKERMYNFEYQKRNIINLSNAADGTTVIKTKYNGNRNTYLNKTASFILETISNNKKMNLGTLMEIIMETYEIDDEERIQNDTIQTLRSLWDLAIISFYNPNPFIEAYQKYPNGDYIIKATHDYAKVIKNFLKDSVYLTPYINIENLTRDEITLGILTGMTQTYLYIQDGEIKSALMIEGSLTSNIMMMYDKDKKVSDEVKKLFDSLVKNEGKDAFILNVMSEEETKVPYELGFENGGLLRKEVDSGDIKMYYF